MAGAAVVLIAALVIKDFVLERWWLRQLRSENAAERQSAARRLSAVGTLRAVPPLMEIYWREWGSCIVSDMSSVEEALEGIGKRNIPALIQALETPKDELHAAAAVLLGHAGSEARGAAPALIQALKDADQRVREAARGALGNMGAEAVPLLIQALGSGDPYIRSAAADAVLRIGPEAKAAGPALLRLLKDQDDEVRQSALGALKETGVSEALVPALEPLLQDENLAVRRKAAALLADITSRTAANSAEDSSAPGPEESGR
jgi:hypothetical protein